MNVRAVEHKLLEEQLSKIHTDLSERLRPGIIGVPACGGPAAAKQAERICKHADEHSRIQEVFDYTTVSAGRLACSCSWFGA